MFSRHFLSNSLANHPGRYLLPGLLILAFAFPAAATTLPSPEHSTRALHYDECNQMCHLEPTPRLELGAGVCRLNHQGNRTGEIWRDVVDWITDAMGSWNPLEFEKKLKG